MQAEIITIGDELLIGQVVDTNSAFMAQRLNCLGIKLKQISSVHDDEKHITKAIDEAFERADIVLATGGLGPTKDDITKLTLCRYFNIGKGPKVGSSVPIPGICNREGTPLLMYRLPSSSRAYPLAFDRKAALYRAMFERVGLL